MQKKDLFNSTKYIYIQYMQSVLVFDRLKDFKLVFLQLIFNGIYKPQEKLFFSGPATER